MTMDFFFPEDNLARAVPEETRITSLRAEPYADRRRVRVNIEITPFQKRPHIDIALFDSDGEETAAASLIEPLSWKLEFTIHIRGSEDPAGTYTLEARLYYPDDGPQAGPVQIQLEIPTSE
ncbi:MAG: hypothetical protein HFACDABA_02658 [Anaerolineales bacterium]|nr:hypothetical protein [Anaerolineales bacterium]